MPFTQSGEELLRSVRNCTGLPDKGGQKDYAPDGSWLSEKRLAVYYNERRETLRHERIRSLGSLVPAEWIPSEERVKLLRNGKFIKTMGYVEDSCFYLLPEEALFLMDEGSILVTYKGVALSVQEGYSVLLGPSLTFEQYQVFAHFTRLGYILRRYAGPSDATSYEKKLKLDRYSKKRAKKSERKRSRGQRADGGEPASKQFKDDVHEREDNTMGISLENKTSECDRKAESGASSHSASDISINHAPLPAVQSAQESTSACSDRLTEDTGQDGSNSGSECSAFSPAKTESHALNCGRPRNAENASVEGASCSAALVSAESCQGQEEGVPYSDEFWNIIESATDSESGVGSLVTRFSAWNFDDICIPDISNHKHVYALNSKSDSLFPSGITLSARKQVVKLPHRCEEEELRFSQGSVGTKARLKASNWAEYKRRLREMSLEDSLLTSPVGHLWQGDDVTPLIQPHEARNTASILRKLKIVENVNLSSAADQLSKLKESSSASDVTVPHIVYDGYKPNSNFTKSDPGTPQFRIVVLRHDEPVPSLHTQGRLTSESNLDGVPLIWAIVQSADISFFSFNGADLPETVSLG